MDSMPLFNNTWTLLSTILNKVIDKEAFGAQEYLAGLNAVLQYLQSSEYHEHYMAACKIFFAAEKLRNENAKRVAEEETKRTGRQVLPDKTDPNMNNESNIPGSELYCEIKTFFQKYLAKEIEKEKNSQGESFLKFYGETWTSFKLITVVANGLCGNLNANWIRRQRSEGRTYIYEIFPLGMNLWNEAFFARSTQILTDKCLKLIEMDRNGDDIKRKLLADVIQSYVAVGASIEAGSHRNSSNTLRLYQEHFEKHFLRETEIYYKRKAEELRMGGEIIAYINSVLSIFDHEEKRITQYLHATTQPSVFRLLEDILIRPRISDIQDHAIDSIEKENVEDLKKAFQLLNRIEGATDRVAVHFENFVKEEGLKTIQSVADRAATDPRVYFETLFEIYQRFHKILKEGFLMDRKFGKHMDNALASIVNENPVFSGRRGADKSAEMLVRYCDLLMRRGERVTGGVSIEETIDKIMIIFNYIRNKDAFEIPYGKLMAKRLINGASASYDHEKLMIQKLKEACGHEYTARLERMLKDIEFSIGFTREYLNYSRGILSESQGNESLPIRFQSQASCSLLILSSHVWPFRPCDLFILPRQIDDYIENCTAFYKHQFTGRNLTWLHQHSKCDLWVKVNGKTYILTTTVYQASIFFLFNESKSWSIDKIIKRTDIEPVLLLPIILALIQKEIIQCPDATANRSLKDLNESYLQLEHEIQLSTTYKNPREKIDISVPAKSEANKQVDSVDPDIEKNRQYMTEACIVRILKARQTCTHQQLIEQIIAQLKNRFTPVIPKIKESISELIGRGYIKRDENDNQVYHYMA